MESPIRSRSSSTASSRARKANLTLDLSDLPPLSQPTPPSNTLLFTNLDNLDIFHPARLETLRSLISSVAPIHAFAPLKSFRRILISFYNIESAKAVRAAWDGQAILGDRVKIYFGQNTPIEAKDEHLALPDAGRLFFISPPPSPPHGWEMRLEDAPNKQVHAEDLADALAKLNASRPSDQAAIAGLESPTSPLDKVAAPTGPPARTASGSLSLPTRSRSSTLIYSPSDHGSSSALPAVFVEDMTNEPEEMSPVDASKPIMAHTARPPVELMDTA